MQAYIQVIMEDVAIEGALPRRRYQLICNLLKDGKLCGEEQIWLEHIYYGVNNNLLPLLAQSNIAQISKLKIHQFSRH
ncbi:MAG: hypothetical protein HC799_13445 [Limnothrix sp. RL_2_0]|nr:hypothetical protein [Limnothrix sp. RL_2_0]